MNAQPVLSPRRHHIALVSPGIQSLAWLKRTLHDLTSANPARQVTVVAPSPYMVSILRQQLVGAGCANLVFSVQLRPIAERIARASRSGALDRPLTGPLEAAAIRAAVRQAAGPLLEPLAPTAPCRTRSGRCFASWATPRRLSRRSRRSPRATASAPLRAAPTRPTPR